MHVRREWQAEQQIGLAIAVLEAAYEFLPARVSFDEGGIDPIPAEIADGDARNACQSRGFQGKGRNVGDDEPNACSLKERDLLSDKLIPLRVERFYFGQGGRHVCAYRIQLDHAGIKRAAAVEICARSHAVLKERDRQIAYNRDRNP